MKEFYLIFLITILVFFSVQTNTMFSLFSFISYALFLFLSFFFFKVEFLTYLFFIIYMGAIVVLFLFIIMLIEFKPIRSDNLEIAFSKILLIFVCFYMFFISIKNQNINVNLIIFSKTIWFNYFSNEFLTFQDHIDIIEIGLILYDCFLVLFINITMLFALGIISVVLLTKQQNLIYNSNLYKNKYFKLI